MKKRVEENENYRRHDLLWQIITLKRYLRQSAVNLSVCVARSAGVQCLVIRGLYGSRVNHQFPILGSNTKPARVRSAANV